MDTNFLKLLTNLPLRHPGYEVNFVLVEFCQP